MFCLIFDRAKWIVKQRDQWERFTSCKFRVESGFFVHTFYRVNDMLRAGQACTTFYHNLFFERNSKNFEIVKIERINLM